jgi:hypothetical protein
VKTYSRRSVLVSQIEQATTELKAAEDTLKATDPSGAKRSHGRSITLTLGQSGDYSSTAAEAMRLKIKLADLEKQLARVDATLGRE